MGVRLPSKLLTVCIDANVLLSAIAFGGKPEQVLDALFDDKYAHVTSAVLLEETRRNLLKKIRRLSPQRVHESLKDIEDISTVVNPSGLLKVLEYMPDNLVLETALLGNCDVLVTGDKQHLLPLNPYKGLAIESPADFLKRLG
ncbi:MAG: putative toxin-antitoxin system toxin component, PIN family [bacterium]